MGLAIKMDSDEIDWLGSLYSELLFKAIFHNPGLVVTAYNSFKPTMVSMEKDLAGVNPSLKNLEVLAAQGKYGILEPMKTIKKAAENYQAGKPYDPGEVAACIAIILRAELICYSQLSS